MAKKRKAKKAKAKKTQAKKTKVKRKGTAKINEPERQPTQGAGTPEHTVTDVPPNPTILGPNSATDL
jgi:Txe/YoeB family toxin of Txe-Axe toxin-antitoxin module